jgi:hypothetical protein
VFTDADHAHWCDRIEPLQRRKAATCPPGASAKGGERSSFERDRSTFEGDRSKFEVYRSNVEGDLSNFEGDRGKKLGANARSVLSPTKS